MKKPKRLWGTPTLGTSRNQDQRRNQWLKKSWEEGLGFRV